MTLPDWPLAGWVVLAALVAWVSAGVVMVIDLAWALRQEMAGLIRDMQQR